MAARRGPSQRRQQAAAATAGRHAPLAADAGDALRRALDTPAAHVFTQLFDPPLAPTGSGALDGWLVSIKDLFDLRGWPTWAGARLRRELLPAPPAAADAAAVARLRAAGATLVGKTNMSEFAFSGVGLNPHFGTPANPACGAGPARIPGGSSSGAAVSVALGIARAGLGSDTGGSLRIPAALCGLVGFKPTRTRVPVAGAFPLATSLDTVGAIVRSVADARVVDGVLAGEPLKTMGTPLSKLKLAVARGPLFDGLDAEVAQAVEQALDALRAAGAALDEATWAEFGEVAALNQPGGLSPIEAYALHRPWFEQHAAAYDPRVAARIALGRGVSAADYWRLLQARAEWAARVHARLAPYDALLAPTVPLAAPRIAALLHDDAEFFRVNGLLLRNTFAFNFADGCALSLPCQAADAPCPVGLMLAQAPGADARLLDAAEAVEQALVAAGLGR
jgi:aspartyl-tRNA(Asn)/glutamyl-tRNA(Gln) amidotransferase subunit A